MLDEPGCCYTGGGELYAGFQIFVLLLVVAAIAGVVAVVKWVVKR